MTTEIKYLVTGGYRAFNSIGDLLTHKMHFDKIVGIAAAEYGLADGSKMLSDQIFECYLKHAIPELSETPTIARIEIRRPLEKDWVLNADEPHTDKALDRMLSSTIRYMGSTMSMVFNFQKVPSSLLKEDGDFDMDEAVELLFKDHEDYRNTKTAV